MEEAINDSGNMLMGLYIIQAYALLGFTLFCFTDVVGFLQIKGKTLHQLKKLRLTLFWHTGTEPATSL